MTKKLPNPHDTLFKKFLTDVEVARDFLQIHLPAHLKSYCDLSTIQIAPGSFVEENLRQHFSDILYAIKIAGQPGYIFCLIEHLTQAKKLTPFQVLRYQIAAMKQHLDQGYKRLPVIIPLVFYRGETSPYPGPVDIIDCFEQPDLARAVFLKPMNLIDLSIIPDETLKTHRRIALLELIEKHIHTRDVIELAHYLVEKQLYQLLSTEQFKSMLHYIDECGRSVDQAAFIKLLESSSIELEYKQVMQTVADYLRNEGMQQGMQQGEHQKAVAIARSMLSEGFNRTLVQRVTGLTDDDLEEQE